VRTNDLFKNQNIMEHVAKTGGELKT